MPMLEAGYSRATADLWTFWLWAMCQEFVFTTVSGYFYPVLLTTCVLFGLTYYSVPFIDTRSLKYHHSKPAADGRTAPGDGDNSGAFRTFMWIMLFLQYGLFITLYA